METPNSTETSFVDVVNQLAGAAGSYPFNTVDTTTSEASKAQPAAVSTRADNKNSQVGQVPSSHPSGHIPALKKKRSLLHLVPLLRIKSLQKQKTEKRNPGDQETLQPNAVSTSHKSSFIFQVPTELGFMGLVTLSTLYLFKISGFLPLSAKIVLLNALSPQYMVSTLVIAIALLSRLKKAAFVEMLIYVLVGYGLALPLLKLDIIFQIRSW
jgi:hypothetical protein